jgi:chemotaxis protein methyltransferase CheR
VAQTEADVLFARVLEGTGAGEGDAQAVADLRRCLGMDPHLAAARFLLGMLLEQRREYAEAAAEYRRALKSLEGGQARAIPFFLNQGRLQAACARALERVEEAARPR